MNKQKWFHVITGKMVFAYITPGIFRDGQGKKVCASLNKICNHMWSQGYVRAGKSVVLTVLEKQMIAMAPAHIAKMRNDIAALKSATKLEIPALAFSSTPPVLPPIPVAVMPQTPVQVETKQQSTAERLAALRRPSV